MPRVAIIESKNPFPGSCKYDTYHLDSSSQDPYAHEKLFYYIDRYAVMCTAYRAVIEVDGYLPHNNWVWVPSIPAPTYEPNRNFVIEETFDESGRDAREDTPLIVQFSPEDRAVVIHVGSIEPHGEVFVSPHTDLILGAAGDPLQLREIHLRNVSGLPTKLETALAIQESRLWRAMVRRLGLDAPRAC